MVLGAVSVGKTSLTRRLVGGNFLNEYDPTVEDLWRTTVDVDGVPAILDIHDLAGQDEFSPMRELWIRECKGFLLVYSIDWFSSFEQAKQLFERILQEKEENINRVSIVLAGNKCDLEDRRMMTTQQGQTLVDDWRKEGANASFFETSAKDKINSDECFFEIVRLFRKKENVNGVEVKTNEKASVQCCTML